MAATNIDFEKLTKKSYSYNAKKFGTFNLENFGNFLDKVKNISASGSTLTVTLTNDKILKFTGISNPHAVVFAGDYENSFQNFYDAKFASSWIPTKGTTVNGSVFDEDIKFLLYTGDKGFTVNANAGDDKVLGTNFDDKINGGLGRDILEGGNGNDKLTGGKNDDRFVFLPTNGIDTIMDATNEDIIQINDSKIDNLRFVKNKNDLEIYYNADDVLDPENKNKIIVKNHFSKQEKQRIDSLGVKEIGNEDPSWYKISDQTITINGKGAITGTATNDKITGSDFADTIKGMDGDDVLIGGKSNDKLSGGLGYDNFQFVSTVDNGTDTITDATEYDTIEIQSEEPIYANQFKYYKNGNNLEIDYSDANTPNNRIIVQNHFQKDGTRVKTKLKVYNEEPVNLAEQAYTITGTGRIVGTEGDDLILGSAKNDTMTGLTGANTYIFSGNSFGKDAINLTDTEKAIIDFSKYAGLKEEDIDFSFKNNNLVIKTDAGQVTLNNFKKADQTGETGSVIIGLEKDHINLKEKLYSVNTTTSYTGSWLNEEIDASNAKSAITINSGMGDDIIKAGTKADTFVFAEGDGYDKIIGATSADKIKINTADAELKFAKNDENLLINYGSGDDSITIEGFFNAEDKIDSILVKKANGKYETISIKEQPICIEVNADYNKTSDYRENLIIQEDIGNINISGLNEKDIITMPTYAEPTFTRQNNGGLVINENVTVTDFFTNGKDFTVNYGESSTHTENMTLNVTLSDNCAYTATAHKEVITGVGSVAGATANTIIYMGNNCEDEATCIGNDITFVYDNGAKLITVKDFLNDNGDFVFQGHCCIDGNQIEDKYEQIAYSDITLTVSERTKFNNTIIHEGQEYSIFYSVIINGTDNADTFTGGAGADTISGGAGADFLAGGDGADTITAGAGNDFVAGEGGNDTLAGGAGNDQFHFNLGDGKDTVTDAAEGDMIVFTDNQNLSSISFARGNGESTSLFITYDNGVGNDVIEVQNYFVYNGENYVMKEGAVNTYVIGGRARTLEWMQNPQTGEWGMYAATTVINGTDGDDTFTSTAENEIFNLKKGNDNITFGKDFGDDEINAEAKDWVINQEGSMNKDILKFTEYSVADGEIDFDVTKEGNLVVNSAGGSITVNNFASPETPSVFIYDKNTDTSTENSTKLTSYEARGFYASSYKIDPHAYNNNAYDHANKSIGTDTYPYGLNTIFVMKGEDAEILENKGKINVYSDQTVKENKHVFATLGGIDMDYWHRTDAADDTCITYDGDDKYEVFNVSNDTKLRIKDTGGTDTIMVRDDRLERLRLLFNVNADGTYDNVNMKIVHDSMITSENFKAVYNSSDKGIVVTANADSSHNGEGIEKILAAGHSVNNVSEWKGKIAGTVSEWLTTNHFTDVDDVLSRGTDAQVSELYNKFNTDYTAALESRVISNIQTYQPIFQGYTGYSSRAFGTDEADTIELTNARGDDYRIYTGAGDDTVRLAPKQFIYFYQRYDGQTSTLYFKPNDGNDTIMGAESLADGVDITSEDKYNNDEQIAYSQTVFEGVTTSGHTYLELKDVDMENVSAARSGDDIVITYQTKNGNEVATTDTVTIKNGYYATNVVDITTYVSPYDPRQEQQKTLGYYLLEDGEFTFHHSPYNEYAHVTEWDQYGNPTDIPLYQVTGNKSLSDLLGYQELSNAGGNADTLKGWMWHDSITASNNGDTITGYMGNDIITGGNGNDTIWGGNGNLWMSYEGGGGRWYNSATSKFYLDNDTIHGGAGNDYIDAGGGVDVIYGDSGDDTIIGSHTKQDFTNDNLYEWTDERSERNPMNWEYITGGKSEELGVDVRTKLFGGTGSDTIYGSGYIFADDVELNQDGSVKYNEDGTTKDIAENAGNDYVWGAGEVHTGYGNDTIYFMGAGAYSTYDSIGNYLGVQYVGGLADAGAGDDTINLGYQHSSCSNSTILGGAGNDEIRSEYRYSKDLSNNKLYGGDGNDHFYLTETNKGNYIDGGADNDTIELMCQLEPNDSDDPDWEKPYSNTVKGGAGDDTLVIMNAQNNHNMEYFTVVGTDDVIVKKIAPLAFFDLTYNSQTHEWETGEDVYINSSYRYDYDIWTETLSTLAFGKKDEAIKIEGALTEENKTETILIKNTTAKESGAVNYTDKNGYRQLDLDKLKEKYITYLQEHNLTSLETALNNETHKTALAQLAISDDVWVWTLKRPEFESDVEVIEGDGSDKELRPDNYRTFGYSGGGVRYTEYYKGSDGNETINAVGGGADYIEAGGGNDIIYAGYGDDTIYGGTGNNTIVFEKGTEYNYYQNQELQTSYLTAGHDVVYSTAGGHDTLVFDNTSLVDFGRNGRDLIIYHDYENQMYGVKDGEIVFNPDNARYSSVTVKDYFANTTDNTVTAGHSVEYIQVAGQEKEAPVDAYSRIGVRILNTDRDLYNNDNVSAMTVYGIGNNDDIEFSLTNGVTRTAFAGEGDDTMRVYAGTVYAYGGEGDDTFTHSNFTPPDESSNLKFAYLDGGEGSDRYDFFEDPFEVLTVVSDSGSDHTGDILQFTHNVYGLKNGVYSTYDVTYNLNDGTFEYGDLYLAGSTNTFSKTAGIKIVDGSVGTIQTATAENDIVYFTMDASGMEGLKSATASWLSKNYDALDAAGLVEDGKVNSMNIVNTLASSGGALGESWQDTLGGNNFWIQHPGV